MSACSRRARRADRAGSRLASNSSNSGRPARPDRVVNQLPIAVVDGKRLPADVALVAGIQRVAGDPHHSFSRNGRPPLPAPRAGRVTLDVEQRHELIGPDAFRVRELTQISSSVGMMSIDSDHFVDACPTRHAARPSKEERDVREPRRLDAVTVPHPPVIVELLAVVAHEPTAVLSIRPSARSRSKEPRDFGVERPDESIMRSPCRRSDSAPGSTPAAFISLDRGHAARGQGWI